MHNINTKNMIYILALLSYQFLFIWGLFFFFFFLKASEAMADYSCYNVERDVTKLYLIPSTLIEKLSD